MCVGPEINVTFAPLLTSCLAISYPCFPDEKLEIYGNPASIQSEEIDGQAETFEIYPNKSMNLIGNARLSSEGNIIKSNLITYQISSNE